MQLCRPRYAFLPLLALLAACDNAAPEADDTDRAASGEVLEGSISDDMLPLESLRSQPPIAEPLPGETVAAPAVRANASAPSGGETADAPATEAAEAPAPEAETP